MCRALISLYPIYLNNTWKNKILIVVSDGESTDGDPEPLCHQLKQGEVKIFTCLLSINPTINSRQLFDKPESDWDSGQIKMFNMSSVVSTSHSSISILRNEGWKIPLSGECRLYAHVNHPDVVKEFSEFANKIHENDALVDLIGKVKLEEYINQSIYDVVPPNQVEKTCYANAIGTVFHFALSRIVGRQPPKFTEIRDQLIAIYQYQFTENHIPKECKRYGLKCKQVDEFGARKAISEKRPVLVIFSLRDEQWNQFSLFYQNNKKGILETSDLFTQSKQGKQGGHAVVLIRCNSNYLTLMNSWGTQWADCGFFKVRDANVLSLKFFDIFWTLDDLTIQEKLAYNEKCKNDTQQLLNQIPKSLKKLPYKCPICNKEEQIEKYVGTMFDAVCPNCSQHFKPTGKDLLVHLYNRNY